MINFLFVVNNILKKNTGMPKSNIKIIMKEKAFKL